MKTAFWQADWFLGLVIAIALFGFARMSGFIPGLERWAYDLGVKMTSKSPSEKIAVIAIDEQSIRNIGRWPWPRDVQAKVIDQLAAAKAKVIGSTIILSEPQKDPGLAYVEKMLDVYNKAYPGAAGPDVPGVAPIGGATPAAQGAQPPGEVAEIGKILAEASVGSGARRIEAVTAGEAFAYLHEQTREADGLRAELDRLRKQSKQPAAAKEVDFTVVAKESNVLFVEAKAVKGGPLRDLSDRLRQQEKADGVIVGSVEDGRAFLVVNFDESLVQRGLDATQLVRDLGKHIGGGGGGKPTLAEAGGKNPGGVREALEAGQKAVAAALA